MFILKTLLGEYGNKMNNRYTLSDSKEELTRLSIQAEELYGGPHFLDDFLSDGAQVLDVACGSGDIANYASNKIGKGTVVGIDSDGVKIKSNRNRFCANNLKFIEGDARAIIFPDNSFDLTYARFLLMHLSEPTTVLKEMIRVTKPGGRVVVHEGIHDAIWLMPVKSGFNKVLKSWKNEMEERGQNHSIGLALYELFLNASLKSPNIKILSHTAFAGDRLFDLYIKNWIEHMPSLRKILKKKLNDSDFDNVIDELKLLNKCGFYLELTSLASGIKS